MRAGVRWVADRLNPAVRKDSRLLAPAFFYNTSCVALGPLTLQQPQRAEQVM